MTAPTRNELPIAFALGLGGYFIGLVLLQQLAFVLAPIPVAVNILAQRPNRAKVYMLVAGLAGLMGIAIGARSPVITCILYSSLGWPIAWAILNRVTYRSLVASFLACMFVMQVIMINLQWEQVMLEMQPALEFFQEKVDGPEAKSLTDPQKQNLNTIIWTLENWRKVYLGYTFATTLVGVCLSIGWIYRAVRRNTDLIPMGSFAEFRPHDATVWIAIAAALLGLANVYYPAPWLEVSALNIAIGLFTLYMLNGISILLYGLNAFKPNPLLAMVIIMTLVFFGGLMFLSIVGLFDTWGDFRKRIDARIQSAQDSQNHSE